MTAYDRYLESKGIGRKPKGPGKWLQLVGILLALGGFCLGIGVMFFVVTRDNAPASGRNIDGYVMMSFVFAIPGILVFLAGRLVHWWND